MASQVASKDYIFKIPFASSIYPQLIPSETLSILHDINASLTPSKRLPNEVLVQIKDEVHRPNTVWQEIRSTWTAAPVNENETDPSFWDVIATYDCMQDRITVPLSKASLDKNQMKYTISEDSPARALMCTDPRYKASIQSMYLHISSADLLYRVRCFFPEVYLDSCDGYKTVWVAGVRHNQTGFGLAFSEYKAAATLQLDLDSIPGKIRFCGIPEQTFEYREKLEAFSRDSVRLLNAFIETVADSAGGAGEPQFTHFHPAAKASRPSSDLRYIAVPTELLRERIEEKKNNKEPYSSWGPVWVFAADLSPQASLRSLLPDLKYNTKSRMIDPINGTTPLTEVISSALLYYRLLCQYPIKPHGNATVPFPNQGGRCKNDAITHSVWQMKFIHLNNHTSHILFMDDRGLFDIRANEDAVKTAMNDIVTLINSLCSDDCAHPYDGTVAGCVA